MAHHHHQLQAARPPGRLDRPISSIRRAAYRALGAGRSTFRTCRRPVAWGCCRRLPTAAPKAPKPTIVLVHGAWADGSGWDKITRQLQVRLLPRCGSPPPTLRSLSGDSPTIASFLATLSGPVVLVGHSYGGAVILLPRLGNSNVKELVNVDAFAPDEGELVFPRVGAELGIQRPPRTTSSTWCRHPQRRSPPVSDLYIKHDVFVTSFASSAWHCVRRTPCMPPSGPSASAPASSPAGAGLEVDPVLVRPGHRDQIITPAAQGVHGLTRRGHDPARSQGEPPRPDLQAERRDQRHRAGRRSTQPRGHVIR